MTYRKLLIYYSLTSIVVIVLLFLSMSDFEIFRADVYYVSNNIERYVLSGIAYIFTYFIAKKFVVGNHLIFLPTITFFLLFLFLVYPGVMITSPNTSSGNMAFYGYLFSLILFNIGIVVSTTINKFKPNLEIEKYYEKVNNIKRIGHSEKVWLVAISLVGLLMLILTIGVDKSGMVRGILDFIQGNMTTDNINDVRESRMNIYKGSFSIFNVFLNYIMMLVLPITSTSLFFDKIKYRKSPIFPIILIIFTGISAIGTGQRRLFSYLILYILIVYSYNQKVNVKKFSRLGVIMIIVLTLQTILLGRQVLSNNFIEDILISLQRVIERIFLVKGRSTRYVFDYFPRFSDFRYGSTIYEKLLGTASDEMPLAVEMSLFIEGRIGTAGPQTFGDFYANFGFIGMLISAFILGFIIQSISIAIIRKKNMDYHLISIIGYMTLLLGLIGYSDIMVIKSNGIHVLFVYLVIFIIYKRLNTKQKINNYS